MQRVTWLEPRTPHQPGKLQKLSKNEFVFTPFIFRVNKKRARFICWKINRVQAVHSRLPRSWCNVESYTRIFRKQL